MSLAWSWSAWTEITLNTLRVAHATMATTRVVPLRQTVGGSPDDREHRHRPAPDGERGKAALARVIALAAEFTTLDDAPGHAADLEQLTAELATVDDLGQYADDLEDLADQLNNLSTTR